MRPKSMILILIALGCGLVASIGISQVMERNGAGDSKSLTAPIYVAVIDISAGEELTAAKIKLEEWPVDKIPEGAIRSPEQLDGKSPTQPMYAGEPLIFAKLADRDKIRGIAPKIRPGYRVMSINVDPATAVSGLLMPGDHVDVMVFMRGRNSVSDKAEAVLENVEVFAVNEQIHRDFDGAGNLTQARTVSLLVTPEQAQQLMYFNQIGVMSLSLRNPDEVGSTARVASVPPSPPVAEPQTTVAMVEPEPAGPVFKMQILQGGTGTVEEFTWDDKSTLPRELQKTSDENSGSNVPTGIALEDLIRPTPTKVPTPNVPGAGVAPTTPQPPAPGITNEVEESDDPEVEPKDE